MRQTAFSKLAISNRKSVLSKFGYLFIVTSINFALIGACVLGQSPPIAATQHNRCLSDISGIFRERTSYIWKGGSSNAGSTFPFGNQKPGNSEKWDLDEFDRIDPAYRLVILIKDKTIDPAKCSGKVSLIGSVVNPLGTMFEFENAEYDLDIRRFTIRTKVREGITYNVTGEIFRRPIQTGANGGFSDGRAVLNVVGQKVGEIVLEFEFGRFQSVMN